MRDFKLNPHLVIKIVNAYVKTDVTKNTKTRKRDIVLPRMMAMFFLCKFTDLNLTQVGRIFDKHHATVLHALSSIPDFIQYDKQIRHTYVSIRANILKNATTANKYSSTTRFRNIADDLRETKRLNALLIHRAINLKSRIDSLPNDVKHKYFRDDEYIYTIK